MLLAAETVAGWMRDAGMSVRRDNVGNVIGCYAAARADALTLLLGSHIDSVRDAGKYDGPLGVLVALACVELLQHQGRRLPFAIELAAFADEEGLRYGTAYLGSKALAGTFDLDYLQRRDTDGIAMADAIRAAGGDPTAIPGDRFPTDQALGYCEVHIEQGPVLEALDLPVGIVAAIAGQDRVVVRFQGMAGHAGTVPMALRRDALAAAAAFVLTVESEGRARDGLVATVGQLAVAPGASNVIPGAVRLSMDVRHQDDAVRAAATAQLHQEALRIGAERGIAVEWELVQSHGAVGCDERLRGLLERAVSAIGYAPHSLVSGAGHDGVVLSTLAPIAMLFVRCAGGISHHPDESVRPDDIAVAVAALARFIDLLAEEQL
jgi:allantoate deiminase